MAVRRRPRVLVACEFSGTVRLAFSKAGAEAWSCDLLPADDRTSRHIVGDVRELLERDMAWDMVIAHPPCTFLSLSGVRWLYRKDACGVNRKYAPRWRDMEDAAEFFRFFIDLSVPHVCVENPIMHGHGKRIVGADQTQIVQPWMFGHGETKATALWLRNLPPLVPTCIVSGREARVHKLPPSEDRWRLRSITYPGIASAMAAQWMPVLKSRKGDANHGGEVQAHALWQGARRSARSQVPGARVAEAGRHPVPHP